MAIDVEALVVSFLRAQSGVTTIVADRVYTDLPHERTYPLVRVSRTGGGSLYKNWLEAAELVLDAYGGTHKLAYNAAQACLLAMSTALVGAHIEGVVTKVEATAVAYNPEPESADPSGHARPRYTVSATVTAHPNRS